jgi:hypothetical protein
LIVGVVVAALPSVMIDVRMVGEAT